LGTASKTSGPSRHAVADEDAYSSNHHSSMNRHSH
jgi:hypothetical protein